MNQAPKHAVLTTTTQQVAVGRKGRVVSARMTGSGSFDLYNGTADTDPQIGGAAGGAVSNEGVMPTVHGYLPEFTNGLLVDITGTATVELLYMSEDEPT